MIPSNLNKTRELLQLALTASQSMTKKTILPIESLFFDLLFNDKKTKGTQSDALKSAVSDLSKALITSFKFAESNDRSVESTFFVYIVANISHSVVKDAIVLIGLLALFLPFVQAVILLRVDLKIRRVGKFFSDFKKKLQTENLKGVNSKFEMALEMLVCPFFNFCLLFAIKCSMEYLFLIPSSMNENRCFTKVKAIDWSEKPPLQVETLGVQDIMTYAMGMIGTYLGGAFQSPELLKLVIFGIFFVGVNLLVLGAKYVVGVGFKRRTQQNQIMGRLRLNIDEFFVKLILGVYIASYGVYK